jgi:hypothetical protein
MIDIQVKGYAPAGLGPMRGSEPMACRLQGVQPLAPSAQATPMAQASALSARAVPGFSGASFHEPFLRGRRETSLLL